MSKIIIETKVIKINDLYNDSIEYACNILRKGGLVAFPTETVYGLGALALNPDAVRRIFEVKGRPQDNPLIVHLSSLGQLESVAYLEPRYLNIIKKLTPGPVTFVLKKKKNIPLVVTAGLDTVGVRIPAHPVAQRLSQCAGPIAAPSANLSGRPSPTDAKSVIEDLYGRVECIIDAGESAFGIESTIIDLTKEKPLVLRPGPVTIEELNEIFGEFGGVEYYVPKSNEKPLAPGMKYRHYAPEKNLSLVEKDKISDYANKDVLILCTRETYEKYLKGAKNVHIIGEFGKPYTIAQNLYKSLRFVDKSSYPEAIIEKLPEEGIFFSIMNRIKKAVSKQ
ncbi:translation factor SUA5 [Fervidobacterium changbaicum]|uniref:Threonylcarbamoyl-AMP synthase n=2 Tax=Fervidobacterium TaxID=2422 RepID=A0AAI8CLW9_FERIS|nr:MULTISPECIES: L-threonylcarbamoyladenylate synthase [Fervidobacterium]AMW32654.1 L-threonylcarbamoyladenylate synthase [Fervidobacterium islandicum]QAV32688.1 threonylcarbamoyl-AMP synthase [Fervidobacterium changbaicum]SDH80143.1 translation factor SUA5 [Fervidobacterium changbaicum]